MRQALYCLQISLLDISINKARLVNSIITRFMKLLQSQNNKSVRQRPVFICGDLFLLRCEAVDVLIHQVQRAPCGHRRKVVQDGHRPT